MSLYKKNLFLPDDSLGIGQSRSGIPTNPALTTNSIQAVSTTTNADTTCFSPFFIPTDGTYSITYVIANASGTGLQEAIFSYKPDMTLGNTLLNQYFPIDPLFSDYVRVVSCSLIRGWYFFCIRGTSDASGQIYASTNSTVTGYSQTDISFFLNIKPLNGIALFWGANCRQYRVYDNSTNPALRHTYNGTLSDFDQYRVANKYLYPESNSITHWKLVIERTA
jgi:hypothetical protein